jgi:hypothetical protein
MPDKEQWHRSHAWILAATWSVPVAGSITGVPVIPTEDRDPTATLGCSERS